MSNVKNIIDNLKNQGANPDKSQINLINELCNLNIRRKFPFYKLLFKNSDTSIDSIFVPGGRMVVIFSLIKVSSETIKIENNNTVTIFNLNISYPLG